MPGFATVLDHEFATVSRRRAVEGRKGCFNSSASLSLIISSPMSSPRNTMPKCARMKTGIIYSGRHGAHPCNRCSWLFIDRILTLTLLTLDVSQKKSWKRSMCTKICKMCMSDQLTKRLKITRLPLVLTRKRQRNKRKKARGNTSH
jgi:hypothetical protein